MATILVIDDRPTNRDVLTTLLGYGGHRVVEAANGLEGLDKVHGEHPDLIITDLLMPGMDGFEFVRKLRAEAEQPNTPVIFCTATYLEPEARVLADASGPHHFVTKPFEPAELLEIVKAALASDGRIQQTSRPNPEQSRVQDIHLKLLQDKLISKVEELESMNAHLEERVRDRTVALQTANDELRDRVKQVEMMNHELEQTRNEQIKLRDDFLSHVSHELRSPLTAIHQFTTILCDGLAGPVAPEKLEYLEIILRNVNQLKGMIDDLLEVTRAQAGKLTVQVRKTSLADAITDVMNIFCGPATAKSVHLLADIPTDFPSVLADPMRLRQVVTNLVDNALKFTPSGGTVIVHAKVLDDTGRSACISVSDTGAGIPVSDHSHIFERLYQGAEARSGARTGLGLGLHICKELTARQDGAIWLDSSSSAGTKFSFTLPIFSTAKIVEKLFAAAPRPFGSVTFYAIEAFLAPGGSTPRMSESSLEEVRRVVEGCLLPDLDVLIPTMQPTDSGGTCFVIATADQKGAKVLLRRLSKQLAGAASLKKVGVSHRIHHEILELGKEMLAENRVDRVSAWITQRIDHFSLERNIKL